MSIQLQIKSSALCCTILLLCAPCAFAQQEQGVGEGGMGSTPVEKADEYPAPPATAERAGEEFYDLLAALVASNERDKTNRNQPQSDVQSDRSYNGLGSMSRPQTQAISKSSVGAVRTLLTLFALLKDQPQFEGKVVGTEGEQTLVEVSPAPDKKRAVVVSAEDGGYRVDLKATWGRWNNWSGEKLDVEWFKITGIIAPSLAGNPEFMREEENARRRSCQSNLKQVMLGILQYAQDYNENYPPARKWIDEIFPYVRNEQIFRCPALPAGDNYGYALNQNLGALNLAKMDNIAQTVAIYETDSLVRNEFGAGEERAYRHLGGSNLAFADGHVKWYAKGTETPGSVSFKP